jgi:hypothetical protein
MEHIYVQINGEDWEDTVIFLSKEEAIESSISKPKNRIEIFIKNTVGYVATYNYYLNGKYISNQ